MYLIKIKPNLQYTLIYEEIFSLNKGSSIMKLYRCGLLS